MFHKTHVYPGHSAETLKIRPGTISETEKVGGLEAEVISPNIVELFQREEEEERGKINRRSITDNIIDLRLGRSAGWYLRPKIEIEI